MTSTYVAIGLCYSDDLEIRVLRALSPDESPLDWESAIETVLQDRKTDDTDYSRDEAVTVVEHIVSKYPSLAGR